MIIYNISPQIQGDTWQGIGSITFLRNSSALDLTGAQLEMFVRASIDSPVVATFTTANSGIIFEDAARGIVSIVPQIVDIPTGNYIYDLKLTLPTGEVKTYLSGKWDILPHVTR